ncbi:hypothetical protein MRB53_003302 [Persea americana]|uniref:Uncharacterized protein n=1 Tax=Persea americana TaxID=3435 RepID=A0ACC2MYL6_PERAE|nr:hypothetical protein MRB53_003302 [Persea americana]
MQCRPGCVESSWGQERALDFNIGRILPVQANCLLNFLVESSPHKKAFQETMQPLMKFTRLHQRDKSDRRWGPNHCNIQQRNP